MLFPLLIIKGFEMATIENMCRAGISIATAKSNMPIGGLQFLSDSLGQMAGYKGGYTTRVGKLLPSYLLGLQQWCDYNDEELSKNGSKPSATRNREREGRNDPYKSFIRTKLNRISQVLQTSRYISYYSDEMMSPVKESGTVDVKGGNLMTEMEAEKEKVVIGETCGQVMPTAVSATQNLDPRSPGILLNKQMDKLRFHSRLLAGPLNDEEETDVDTHEGDYLTLLRKKLNDRTDTEKELARVEGKAFDPSEFEKYEKENFVISDHISEEETFFVWSRRKADNHVSSRTLPRVAVSDLECHRILLDMRKVCGDSPVTHLTPEILKNIFSDRNDHCGAVSSRSITVDGQYTKSYEVSDSSAYNNILSDNECESVSDSNGEDRNRVAEECSPIAVEDLPEEHLHQPISLDPVGNFDGSIVGLHSRDTTTSAVVAANDDAYCIAKETLIDLTKNLQTAQAVISEFRGDVEMSCMSGVDVIIDTTSQKVNINEALIVDIARKIPEDPAAAHRRKVRKLLAELNSIDSIRDEDRIGGAKETRFDSINSNSVVRVGDQEVKAHEKREESESALIEQQTDILARLLEQRIHDRWAQASAESQVQSPFKHKN